MLSAVPTRKLIEAPRRLHSTNGTGPVDCLGSAIDEWKRRVASAFGKAAHQYDDYAEVQREVVAKLVERISRLALPRRPRVLEIGCGTGLLTLALSERIDAEHWVVTDLSSEMVASCREHLADRPGYSYLSMDGEMPALNAQFDLICSSMAMQWFVDLEESLPRLASLLRPEGYLAFSTLVEGTFEEWREAHERVGEAAAMLDYPSVERLRGLWPEGGMRNIETELVRRHYPTPGEFLSGLKRLGANTPGFGGPPASPTTLRKLLRGSSGEGGFQITYNVAYGVYVPPRARR